MRAAGGANPRRHRSARFRCPRRALPQPLPRTAAERRASGRLRLPQAKQAVLAKAKGFSDHNASWLKLKRQDVDVEEQDPKKAKKGAQTAPALKAKSEPPPPPRPRSCARLRGAMALVLPCPALALGGGLPALQRPAGRRARRPVPRRLRRLWQRLRRCATAPRSTFPCHQPSHWPSHLLAFPRPCASTRTSAPRAEGKAAPPPPSDSDEPGPGGDGELDDSDLGIMGDEFELGSGDEFESGDEEEEGGSEEEEGGSDGELPGGCRRGWLAGWLARLHHDGSARGRSAPGPPSARRPARPLPAGPRRRRRFRALRAPLP